MLSDIKGSAEKGKLVLVLGAGTSMALASKATPAVNWPSLIDHAFLFAKEKGRVDQLQYERWTASIHSDDLDELLSAADFVSRKLGGNSDTLYARWLEQEFSRLKAGVGPMRKALRAVAKSRIPISTLNYDTLVEDVTKLPTIHMDEPQRVLDWIRQDGSGILHLHGTWEVPKSCIFGASDYQQATSEEFRKNLQRSLSTFNRLLFVGCGGTINDPNFSALIKWMRDVLGPAGLQHAALVHDDEVELRHQDLLWQGFIEPIGYGGEYDDLPKFLMKEIVPATNSKPIKSGKSALSDSPVIGRYKKYLIKDCGQMTIEGIRADADTAKQKFDIESLFVPLSVASVAPDLLPNDPHRERKIKKWQEENPDAIPFGVALAKHNRLALLALPGGGKTLLLKRLAVAYADAGRRSATDDKLPQLDLLPILVRCREWRDHIKLPIRTLIEKIGEITGQSDLDGLYQASHNRFKSGKILLLVDGLDEIHNDADRTIFVDNLESFLKEFPKIRLVVTSREAGFALIAPNLMRFCDRWRIAPLSKDAICLLCTYWQKLMGGSSKETDEEVDIVVSTILGNHALTGLAENPLLLTMLLVVKHGHGRLPPDRVSLYDRAVDVLLDTWNIKGHDALNPREAVPQLAYIAFKLTQRGQQTATERDLLEATSNNTDFRLI